MRRAHILVVSAVAALAPLLPVAAQTRPDAGVARAPGPAAVRPNALRPNAVTAVVEVAVLNRPVQRGERLSVQDFSIEERAANLARGAVPMAAAAGMEVVRTLNSGSVVRVGDIMSPRLVRRGEPVLIAYKAGLLTITAQGRAMASAGAGEPVRVVATSTQRTLDGIVAGQGLVRVAY